MIAKRFAVVGNPIEHSLSPQIHECFAEICDIEIVYKRVLATEENFDELVQRFFEKGGRGLNVTSPFKPKAFAIAHQHMPRVLISQSANTLWCDKGEIIADSTDGLGLINDLLSKTDLKGKNVLMLGAGGATRGAIEVLVQNDLGKLHVANRTRGKVRLLERTFHQITTGTFDELEGEFDIIINATSASLQNEIPDIDAKFYQNALAYDLAYDIEKDTPFCQHAKEKGASLVSDGLGMLVHQAAGSFTIWHKRSLSQEDIDKALKQLRP